MDARFASLATRPIAALTLAVSLTGFASPAQAQDEHGDVGISVITGISIDSFAASELKKYLNPQASGAFQEQLVADFKGGPDSIRSCFGFDVSLF
jgi:hypothetical protein